MDNKIRKLPFFNFKEEVVFIAKDEAETKNKAIRFNKNNLL